MKKAFSAFVILLFSLQIHSQPKIKIEKKEVLKMSPGSVGTFFYNPKSLDRLKKQARTPLPAKFNLREENLVNEPLRQNHGNGQQNAKAINFSVESKFIMDGIIPLGTRLSQQNLLWCPSFNAQLNFHEPAVWTNPTIAIAYYATEKGPLYATDHHYLDGIIGGNGKNKEVIDTCAKYSGIKPVRNIFEMVKLPYTYSGNGVGQDDFVPRLYDHATDNETIKELIRKHGAIGARLATPDDNPILHPNYCITDTIETARTNNSFNIIGWDDDYSCNCNNLAGTNPQTLTGAWIIDRSIDPGVIDQGKYLSYHNFHGFYEVSYFPTHEALDPERDLLYYDTLGWCRSLGFSTTSTPVDPYPELPAGRKFGIADSGYITAKFNAGGRLIERVATYALGTNTTMEVEVYSGRDKNNNLFGLLTKGSRTVEYPGHYVIQLNDTVYAQEFYVRIKYKIPDYEYTIPVEMLAYTHSIVGISKPVQYSNPVIEKGVAWVSSDPSDPFAYPIGLGNDILADPCMKIFSRLRIDLRLKIKDHEKIVGDNDPNYLSIIEWDGPNSLKSGHKIDFFGRKKSSSEEVGFHIGPDSLRVVDAFGADVTREYSFVPELVGTLNIQPKAPTSSIFKDNVWLFGENETIANTSKGLNFVKKLDINNAPYYAAKDFSNQSNVNATGNSLSVGGVNCESDILFYVSDNKVYNGKHKVMGDIQGSKTYNDGLATVYLGQGKYLLASAFTTADWRIIFYFYTIDINANKGKGSVTLLQSIGGGAAGFFSDMIRFVPKVGTSNDFWMLSYVRPSTIKLYEIEGNTSTITEVKKLNFENIVFTNQYSIQDIKFSPDFKKLAILNKEALHLYWFNVDVFEWRHRSTIKRTGEGVYHSAEFTADSKNLLLTDINKNRVFRYNIKDVYMLDENHVTDSVSYGHPIGGVKRGVDGKMYIVTPNVNNLKVLSGSNVSLASMLNPLLQPLNSKGKIDLRLSTGITSPWDDPAWATATPSDLLAVNDTVFAFWGDSIGIIPILNDAGTDKTISSAHIVNPTYRKKASIDFENGSDTLIFTVAQDSTFTTDEIIRIEYILKDKAVPFYNCANAFINIKYIDAPSIRLLDSCSFNPKLAVSMYYKNVDFEWQMSDTKTGTYAKVDIAKDKCPATKAGFYRIKFTNKSTKGIAYSEIVELTVEETKVSKRTWYITKIVN